MVRGISQTQLGAIRLREAGEAAVPDPAGGLHERLQERALDAAFRVSRESPPLPSGRSPGAPQHLSGENAPDAAVATRPLKQRSRARGAPRATPCSLAPC